MPAAAAILVYLAPLAVIAWHDVRTLRAPNRYVYPLLAVSVVASLTLYRDQDHGDLFLPFQDATSGRDTYGAGRYLEVPVLEETEDGDPLLVLLDFNYAHHPFCAYNPHYSCPLPPAENRLSVRIEAGERNPGG